MNQWTTGDIPRGFWKDKENHLRYAEWLGELLGFHVMDDWYRVRKNHFQANFGGGLLKNYYGNSASLFVRENYPDYPWKRWQFGGVPDGFWDDPANRRAFMTDLGVILGYKTPEDWYRITCRLIHQHGGGGLLVGKFESSPQLAVIEHIPDFPWKLEEFAAGKKTQKALFSAVQQYLWSMDPKWDFKNKQMLFHKTQYPMELDIFIPHLEIAIEYQGEQHFVPIECWGGEEALKNTQARDEEKRKACKTNHIDLIEVNYWWRGETKVIVDAIRTILESRQNSRPEFKMIGSKKYKLFLPAEKRRENSPSDVSFVAPESES